MKQEKRSSAIILIGGSAGSLPVILQLLRGLPARFEATVVIILHRLKNKISDMDVLLSNLSGVTVTEPEDKTEITTNSILLAPQNYHLLAEEDGTISLDYSEPEQNSRPSINVTFESFAQVYGPAVTGIVLSGSNNDGTTGLAEIIKHGGKAYVQDPDESEYPVMPDAAKRLNPSAESCTVAQLDQLFKSLLQ
jgi:two-component system chemotaxis response regulator CheB